MLYSIGKDSAVMLHLARKAFYPGKPPFPLMHVDTTWKFRDMIDFRDRKVKEYGLDLIVHKNEDGIRQGIGPFTHGSAKHTDVMKTQALKQALDKYKFDAAFGGARRDEEKSRANTTAGTPRTNVLNSGTSTTARSTRAKAFGYSRCPTGPSWISGSTSTWKISRSFPFTTPRCARWLSATAP